MADLCCLKKCKSGLHGMICHSCYEGAIATLRQQVVRLREALKKYRQHLDDCHSRKCSSIGYHPAHNPGRHECTCGLDATLREGG